MILGTPSMNLRKRPALSAQPLQRLPRPMMGLLPTITLRANQNVTGLALTIFGTGAGQFLGEYMRVKEGGYVAIGNSLKAIFVNSPFPTALQDIPILGWLLFKHNIMTYIGIALALAMAYFLSRTRKGQKPLSACAHRLFAQN